MSEALTNSLQNLLEGRQKRERSMELPLTAIELTGTVDESHQLQLDGILPIPGPMRVRVIVLYSPMEEWNEKDWLHSASLSPVLNYLKDPEEDIYSPSDGKPFHDEV